jgi:hypothetical protein
MKTTMIQKLPAMAVAIGLAGVAFNASAQNATVPQLPDGAAQVLQLEQANISDSTILAFIQNSGASYNLSAAQIIYLKQQGIHDSILTAMLTQPKGAVVASAASQPAVTVSPAGTVTTAGGSTATVQPTTTAVTYVQQPGYYADPYYYPYAYPYGYWWPPVALSFGWGWGGHWGGGGHWHR